MTRKFLSPTLLVIIALIVTVSGCSQDATSPQVATSSEDSNQPLDKILTGVPSEAEIADLLFMREEEKLARDVYMVLGGQYDLVTFASISSSEQKHMNAIKNLLDRYSLEDPVGENGIGVFTNETLQALYNDLIASGEQSAAEALLVGLAIEEIDILDLQDAMDVAVLRDILKVYGNLFEGSKNHLRCFVADYESLTGETYVPRWLTQEAYDAILAENPDHGGSRKPIRVSF